MPSPRESSAATCTCGHEESDGRGDVLDCRVHGIGPVCKLSGYPAPCVDDACHAVNGCKENV